MSYRIGKIDELKQEIVKELNLFNETMQDVGKFKDWLFQREMVQLRHVERFERNEETGEMERKMEPKKAFVATSNGHNQVNYLIDMAKLSGLKSIASKVDDAIDMIVEKTVNDDAYYLKNDNGNAFVKPFEYDLRMICENYLSLPLSMQNKDTLVNFFDSEEITDRLGALGYDVAKLLMTEFKNKLTSKDISKLVEYIESRLWKMEDKIKEVDNRSLDKEVKEAISRIENGKPQGKAYTEDIIRRLKRCNSKVRHYVKAKYNRELSRYFELLEPYGEGNKYVGDEVKLVNLYEDLKKTYDILNDQQYVDASRRHDEQIKFLKEYLAKCSAKKSKDCASAKALKPIIWTDDHIMD